MYEKNRRNRTSFDKVAAIKNASKTHFSDIEKYFQETALVTSTDAIPNDSTHLVGSEPKSSFRIHEFHLRELSGGTLYHHQDRNAYALCSDLFEKPRSEGFRVFPGLSGLYFDVRKEDVSSAGHKKLQFCSSVYVSNRKTPTLSDKIFGGSLPFQSSSTLIFQRDVVENSFHGLKE